MCYFGSDASQNVSPNYTGGKKVAENGTQVK